ncbi:hypothetical protein K438DRAFT_1771159 [Mycena galopus ATCC 62051]|nr:hypothetical protein K438DRAFT_1771159 [Mycena galopus ATCC 62051]
MTLCAWKRPNAKRQTVAQRREKRGVKETRKGKQGRKNGIGNGSSRREGGVARMVYVPELTTLMKGLEAQKTRTKGEPVQGVGLYGRQQQGTAAPKNGYTKGYRQT